ncbi:MAG: SirB2 family protein [Propionivibrio sp.]|uniref:SirB2 family protein n=1 Tax=Candidatus Propionivibrio dominans TaxID=2954373 RepID=A0A9D7FBB4_9RHOO|nr:SirB2 family protein [Candidatus Propionivibrio dominans]MBL0166174.1 SirB2 family protein [Propionivibrio sp.]
MIYLSLKNLHVLFVVVSGSGFFIRGLWMLADSPRLNQRSVRIVPHIVDTLLLGSAIAMAVISAQYPGTQDWLTAKLIGLLVYIFCGMMALRRGKSKTTRGIFFAAALLAFAYIVSVALTRSPLGVFSW